MVSQQKSQKSYLFVGIAIIAAFAGILFGYDTGVMSGAILFINHQFQLNAQTNGIIMAAVLLGAMFGAIMSGRVSDKFDRKSLLVVVALIFILGSLLTAFANGIWILGIGRVIVGIAIGVASYAAPLYISEIAPSEHRGALVSLNQLAISAGILLAYIVDYISAKYGAWRWMLGLGAIPGVILFVGMIVLPGSPRWLVSKGRMERALQVLRRIRGEHFPVEQELESIRQSMHVQHTHWRILFSSLLRPVLIVGVGLTIIQQVTGINTILYYAPTIFTMTGFEGNSGAILATMGIGVVFVLFTLVSLPLIDKWGRRPLLMLGIIGMAMSLLAMAWGFHQHTYGSALQWIILLAMLIYIACFAISLGPIMWLMIAEIYPLSIRGTGASFATAVNWASNMIVALTFLTLVEYLGTSATLMIYFICCILSLLFVYFLVPETKGVSLEQIEINLYAGKSARQLGR